MNWIKLKWERFSLKQELNRIDGGDEEEEEEEVKNEGKKCIKWN